MAIHYRQQMPAAHADALWAALGWAVATLAVWDKSDRVGLPQLTAWQGIPPTFAIWAMASLCKAFLRGLNAEQQAQVLREVAAEAERGAAGWDGTWPRLAGSLPPGWDSEAGQ